MKSIFSHFRIETEHVAISVSCGGWSWNPLIPFKGHSFLLKICLQIRQKRGVRCIFLLRERMRTCKNLGLNSPPIHRCTSCVILWSFKYFSHYHRFIAALARFVCNFLIVFCYLVFIVSTLSFCLKNHIKLLKKESVWRVKEKEEKKRRNNIHWARDAFQFAYWYRYILNFNLKRLICKHCPDCCMPFSAENVIYICDFHLHIAAFVCKRMKNLCWLIASQS